MWRNWQTHMTQNHAGNHVGSSPTIGTIKSIAKAMLKIFKNVGLEKERTEVSGQLRSVMKRGKIVQWTILRRGRQGVI